MPDDDNTTGDDGAVNPFNPFQDDGDDGSTGNDGSLADESSDLNEEKAEVEASGEDYVNEVFDHIDAEEDVSEASEEGGDEDTFDEEPKKKKRRRRRRRKKPVEEADVVDEEPEDEIEFPDEPVNPFGGEEADVVDEEPEDEIEFPDEPVNPFGGEEADVVDEEPVEESANPFGGDDTPAEETSDKPADVDGAISEAKEFEDEPEPVKEESPFPSGPFENGPSHSPSNEPSETEVVEGEVVEQELTGEDKEMAKELEDKLQMPTEEAGEDFWDVLEQAGITKGKIFGLLTFIIVIIVAGLFYFSGVFSSGGKVDEPKEDAPKEVVEVVEDKKKEDGESGVTSSYVFGDEQVPTTPIVAEPIDKWGSLSGLTTSYIFGFDVGAENERFVYYIDLLKKMQNLYATDVYQVVNLSADRRDAYERFVVEYSSIMNEGYAILNTLRDKMVQLDAEYEVVFAEKNISEESFFANAEGLNGPEAYADLQKFIEFVHVSDTFKAQYNSYKLLAEMYENSLSALKPRFDDISSNMEAILKGVKVFDIPGSDINAIIRMQR